MTDARRPISFLKTYTSDAAPESQYPPATEQPEDECVVDLRAHSFESVCQVVTEDQVLQAKLARFESVLAKIAKQMTTNELHAIGLHELADIECAYDEMIRIARVEGLL